VTNYTASDNRRATSFIRTAGTEVNKHSTIIIIIIRGKGSGAHRDSWEKPRKQPFGRTRHR
jgi:hypothetical protein